jgi:hypothetical protein
MIIKLNTDKNISGNAKLESYLDSVIRDDLTHYGDHLTRIEVHLSDENGGKKGENDKRCMLEARLANAKPVAVTSHANTVEHAVSEALDKLKSAMDKRIKKN